MSRHNVDDFLIALLAENGKRIPPTGLEPPPQNTRKQAVSEAGGAKSGALSTNLIPVDSDQQRILDAWPTLPEPLRAGILAMIEAARIEARSKRRE